MKIGSGYPLAPSVMYTSHLENDIATGFFGKKNDQVHILAPFFS